MELSRAFSNAKVTVVEESSRGSKADPPSFVRVHSYPVAENPEVRVAVVEHHYPSSDLVSSSAVLRTCLTLVDHERMSHETAMRLAVQYAEETGVEVVYERNEVNETADAAEDDTRVLRTLTFPH